MRTSSPEAFFSRELKQRLFVNEVVVANRILFLLREDVSIYRTNLKYCGKSPKFVFPSTSIFCSPICSSNCGVAFFVKIYFSFREMIFFVRLLKMQIFTVNITRVVWPRVTNVLDLRYSCEHNPLFYHINLIPCRYWSWQKNIYFLMNIFVRHSFLNFCDLFLL